MAIKSTTGSQQSANLKEARSETRMMYRQYSSGTPNSFSAEAIRARMSLRRMTAQGMFAILAGSSFADRGEVSNGRSGVRSLEDEQIDLQFIAFQFIDAAKRGLLHPM
jgi:hypothetical protein